MSPHEGEPALLRLADLSDLPESLEVLDLADVVPDSNYIREYSSITYLRLLTSSTSQGPHLRLLHQLPNLRVGSNRTLYPLNCLLKDLYPQICTILDLS